MKPATPTRVIKLQPLTSDISHPINLSIRQETQIEYQRNPFSFKMDLFKNQTHVSHIHTPRAKTAPVSSIPRPIAIHSREKEIERYKTRIEELKQKVDDEKSRRGVLVVEGAFLKGKFEEIKKVMDWRNRDNVDEVLDQLKHILVQE